MRELSRFKNIYSVFYSPTGYNPRRIFLLRVIANHCRMLSLPHIFCQKITVHCVKRFLDIDPNVPMFFFKQFIFISVCENS